MLVRVCGTHESILFAFLLILELVHVHFDTALHRRFCHISQRDIALCFWGMSSGISDVFLETSLLVIMDVLLVVLNTADLSHLGFVMLSKFHLVQSLAKHTLSGHFDWLCRIVSKS